MKKLITGLILSILSLNLSAAVSDVEIENFLMLPSGTLDSISTGDAINGSALQGSYFINAGDTFSFDFTWNTGEGYQSPYNDFAFYSLSLDNIGILADTFTPNNDTGDFSWTADRSGQLDFGIGVMNLNDSFVNSSLYINNLFSDYGPITGIGDFVSHGDGAFTLYTSTSPVPLPAAAWLFLTGIPLLMFRGKNKSASTT